MTVLILIVFIITHFNHLYFPIIFRNLSLQPSANFEPFFLFNLCSLSIDPCLQNILYQLILKKTAEYDGWNVTIIRWGYLLKQCFSNYLVWHTMYWLQVSLCTAFISNQVPNISVVSQHVKRILNSTERFYAFHFYIKCYIMIMWNWKLATFLHLMTCIPALSVALRVHQCILLNVKFVLKNPPSKND